MENAGFALRNARRPVLESRFPADRRTIPLTKLSKSSQAHTQPAERPSRAPWHGLRPGWVALLLLIAGILSGCSPKQYAINKLGDSLASSSASTFSTDNDPDLVADAVPFSLKLVEALIEESPRHQGLLQAAASGYTQYAYAFVEQKADEAEATNLEEAGYLRNRARNLYLRARDYGLRALSLRHKDFSASLRTNAKQAVRAAAKADVPLLYWTGVSWGAAISLSKDSPEVVADQLLVEALMDRAIELDEAWDAGSIHGFFIAYESNRQGAQGDAADRIRKHFDRAVQLSGGKRASPYVTLAETVSVTKQDRKEFESLLQQALAVNPDEKIEWRLSNLIAQRRARWLLGRTDELFIE